MPSDRPLRKIAGHSKGMMVRLYRGKCLEAASRLSEQMGMMMSMHISVLMFLNKISLIMSPHCQPSENKDFLSFPNAALSYIFYCELQSKHLCRFTRLKYPFR